MRIAIIGSGVSGLAAGYRLHREHDITLFEAEDYVGGHVSTIDCQVQDRAYSVDTGFIVYNERTYPNFTKLLAELDVATQPTEMSFSVRCDQTGLEYCGSNLNGLFAQRLNLFRPGFHRLWLDIVRFNRESIVQIDQMSEDATAREFFAKYRYSRDFIEKYFLPMGSAIWSCPCETFEAFPMRFVLEFYRNHGLLSLRDRPQWRVICGGSKAYVSKLTATWRDRIKLGSPVQRVSRAEHGVRVFANGQESGLFDHVIFACHSDQALAILGEDASDTERELLSAFPYQKNSAVLHTDTSVLPARRRAWASWNYCLPEEICQNATLTYNMSRLQRIESPETFCVTLNRDDHIDPSKVIRRMTYAHPVFTTERRRAQSRHAELINVNRTSFCGAYWGNGFHEAGMNSAIRVYESIAKSSDSNILNEKLVRGAVE